MNSEQAKFVLAAYRPEMDYEDDPVMAEAIDQLLRDPELARWFADERELDETISKMLLAESPPADLRTQLLAGLRASAPYPSRGRQLANVLGIAAGVALVCGLALVVQRSASDGANGMIAGRAPLLEWQTACVEIFADPDFRLDLTGSAYPVLERNLLERGTRVAGELPFATDRLAPIGCKVLAWRGLPVSLACFRAEGGEVVHLFVLPRGVADESLLRVRAHSQHIAGFATITWLQGDLIRMVASRMPADRLAPMVRTHSPYVASASTTPREGS